MLVSYPNDVKIYNLSAGKSLPEWLTDRKRRKLLQDDVDLRRRIELIQDFDMPDCSNCVTLSKNGDYIFTCGTYKPRVKCYEVKNLSMKFERCMDAEPIKALVLSEGYEKVIFLQEDRWVELHVQYGRYFRLRIPKFGRDIAYNETNCDLYVIGAGSEVYRLNLEQGRFMTSLTSESSSLTHSDLNSDYQLLMIGTIEGKVEAWDPRAKTCVGTLDTAQSLITENIKLNDLPSVSSLKFKNNLQMAVGTATGQILMYDIRSNKPYLVKDHNCDLPITSLAFSSRESGLVLSMDKRLVKIWHETDNGKPYTTVEPGVDLNDLCLVPGTGMFFLANENQKLLTYYIPGLGPAPRWCSFLDNITEELEEMDQPEVFDDYKFVTPNELEDLGLTHLIGSKLLRAYMHGYFMDARLHNKAKAFTNPLAYQEYKKQKVREKLDEERSSRVQLKKLPNVNKKLAERLSREEAAVEPIKNKNKKQASAASLLHDERFKALFEKSEFQVDTETEEFRLINPAVARLERQKAKKSAKAVVEDNVQDQQIEDNVKSDGASTSSSEDDDEYREQVRKTHREIKEKRWLERKMEKEQEKLRPVSPRKLEIKSYDDFQGWSRELKKRQQLPVDEKESLETRLAKSTLEDAQIVEHGSGREMTFASKKQMRQEETERKVAEHVRDRRKVRRSAVNLSKKPRR